MGREGETRLVRLASRQFGVVTAKDIIACDVPQHLLWRRLQTGEWMRLHPGVFKLGSSKLNIDELEMAALFAAGDGAVLSHHSAAARLGLEVPPKSTVQITIPCVRRSPKLSGVRVWLSRALPASDVTRRGPFRLTHLARTIVDLASVLDDKWLRGTLDSALRAGRNRLSWISQVLDERGNGRRGARRLRRLIAEYRDGDEVPDSVLESFALQLARAIGHEPKLHWDVGDEERWVAEVDLAWPEIRLCVQLDGWKWHSSRKAFADDRALDRAIQRLGWMVLRYTWHEVNSDPESWIAQMVDTYESRAADFRRRKRRVDRPTIAYEGCSAAMPTPGRQ